MAVSVTYHLDLLTEARKIQTALEQHTTTIPNKSIDEQFFTIPTISLEYQNKLALLQQKIESFFLAKGAIQVSPGVRDLNENFVKMITDSIFKSIECLGQLSITQEKILDFKEIYDKTIKNLQSWDQNKKEIENKREIAANPGISLAYQQLSISASNSVENNKDQIDEVPIAWSCIKPLPNDFDFYEPKLNSKIKELKEKEQGIYKTSISSVEFHDNAMSLFKELRILARNNPGLEKDSGFFSLYSNIFTVVVKPLDGTDRSASVIEILKETKPLQCGAPIEELQKALVLLQQNQPDAFGTVIIILKTLANAKVIQFFPMNHYEPRGIADRIYFHLLNIHRIEEPNRIKSSTTHGRSAFTNEEGATHSQRCRALQRTLAELALFDLEEAINAADATKVAASLKILEEIALPATDLPHEKNMVEALSAELKDIQVEARKSNPALIDPNLPEFNGNFGKAAFSLFASGLLKEAKLKAIDQVYAILEGVWGIRS